MPRHHADAPSIETIEQSSPLIDLRKRGIADLLARQQEEYDGYVIESAANDTPPIYQVRLRAAHQAALKCISSDDFGRQYPWSRLWVAVAVAFSILLFLKLRFG